jgi:hypothetical protein
MPGQINLDTPFGQELRALAANPNYTVFCEVGTWNGEGSTRCLWEGMRERPGTTLFSFEANAKMAAIAAQLWKDTPAVKVIYGRLAEKMMSEKEIREHPLFKDVETHFRIHYLQDVEDFGKAPLLGIPFCDVVVLDGGEFSGYEDWLAIKDLCPNVVCLDDVKTMKNELVFKELQSSGWKMIYYSDARNGEAIFERPGFF